MCTVSVMSNSFQQNYPDPQSFPLRIYPDLSAVFEKLKAIDDKLGAKDCQDIEKKVWWAAIEARVKALEEQSNG